MEKTITRLQLQARKAASSEWGILNTVLIGHEPSEPDGRGIKKARAEVNSLRNRWIENYIPDMQFRVVEL